MDTRPRSFNRSTFVAILFSRPVGQPPTLRSRVDVVRIQKGELKVWRDQRGDCVRCAFFTPYTSEI